MFLKIKNIVKKYEQEQVVGDLNFSLERHKTLSILGKSGCGKTTTLKIISGLVEADEGRIFLEGEAIEDRPPEHRNTVYLYQEDLLFPHLNAFENIAFGLRLKKEMSSDQINQKVQGMIRSLELEGQGEKMPHQLSGGQRQRVSFGRAMITNPSLLLLDEPFASLDTGTRQNMQRLFKKLTKKFNITSIFVTHALKEAILMGDEIAYMKNGRLELYNNKNEFINDPKTGVREEIDFWEKLNNNF